MQKLTFEEFVKTLKEEGDVEIVDKNDLSMIGRPAHHRFIYGIYNGEEFFVYEKYYYGGMHNNTEYRGFTEIEEEYSSFGELYDKYCSLF